MHGLAATRSLRSDNAVQYSDWCCAAPVLKGESDKKFSSPAEEPTWAPNVNGRQNADGIQWNSQVLQGQNSRAAY